MIKRASRLLRSRRVPILACLHRDRDEAAAFPIHDSEDRCRAVGLLGKLDNAKPAPAGGQSLMPMLNMRFVQPDHIIDINLVEACPVSRRAAGRSRSVP
jgi:hypothetical protein